MIAAPHRLVSLNILVAMLANLPLARPAAAAIGPRSQLDTFFETGDKPTEDQFADLIDSQVDLVYTFGSFTDGHTVGAPSGGISTSAGAANRLALNQEVGPGLAFQLSANLGTGSDWPGNSGYLGFQFQIDDPVFGPNTHYGFLQMSVDAPGSATPYAIRGTGIAYESTPNTPITIFTIVPEPATAILFVLPVVVLAVCRPQRKKGAGPFRPRQTDKRYLKTT